MKKFYNLSLLFGISIWLYSQQSPIIPSYFQTLQTQLNLTPVQIEAFQLIELEFLDQSMKIKMNASVDGKENLLLLQKERDQEILQFLDSHQKKIFSSQFCYTCNSSKNEDTENTSRS